MNDLIIRTGLERTLLRALFLDQEYVEEIINVLGSTGKHFDEEYNKKSYEVILSLFYSNREFSQFNFINELGLSITKPQASAQYVKILSAIPTNNPVEVAYTILEQAMKRQLYFLAENIKKKALGSESYTDIYLDIDATLKQINQDTLNNNLKHLSAVVKEFNNLLDKHVNPLNIKTVTSGYKAFDAKLKGGFSPGQFVILAARPSMGKSALMSDMAVRIARQKIPLAIFSLEMTQQELMLRMLNQAAQKDIIGDRGDILNNKEVRQFLEHMGTYPIYIDDSGRMDMLTLKTKARRLVRENNVQILFLDYLQLMHTNSHNTREREVAELSRDLKLLAKDLSIPVVCLAQLNRAVEMREGKMPLLSDLRESGSIEQDADVVMFVHRKQYYDATADSTATINFAKNRTTGEIGDVQLIFNKETASFI